MTYYEGSLARITGNRTNYDDLHRILHNRSDKCLLSCLWLVSYDLSIVLDNFHTISGPYGIFR